MINPMLMKKYILAFLFAVVVIGGYFWYLKNRSASSAVQYVTVPAEKSTLVTSVSGSGNVIVDNSVNIDPTITGTVTNLTVNVGDQVKKGQLLFTIFNDQLGVNASQSFSSYKSALSSLDSAKSDKKAAQASYVDTKRTKTTSYADVLSTRRKVQSSNVAIDAAQQGVNSALSDLSYQDQQAADRSVTSPIDGTVNEVNIKDGDDLSKLSSGSSRTIPIIIGDLSTLEAQVQINEIDVPNVKIGQKATMSFAALPDLTVTGEVQKMDSLGTIVSGVVTYDATISFDTLSPLIKSGMSVTAAVITGEDQDVITVPNAAVKTQSGNNYVQVLVNGSPEQRQVQTGLSNNTDTEITSGLNVSDQVITKTINPTSTGSQSTVPTPTPAPGAGGGGGVRIPGFGGGGGGRPGG